MAWKLTVEGLTPQRLLEGAAVTAWHHLTNERWENGYTIVSEDSALTVTGPHALPLAEMVPDLANAPGEFTRLTVEQVQGGPTA